MSTLSQLKGGLTWRVILAIAYTAIVFIPTEIYLNLATGTTPTGVPWFALLLMAEIGRMTNRPLTKQESTIIYSFAGGLFIGPIFVNKIFALWFRSSPIATAFGLSGDLAPSWFAPLLGTGVWEARTFLNPSWLIPIVVPVAMTIATGIGSISLGLFAKTIFVEVEKLPFPVQQMQAQGILVLTERHKERLEIMCFAAIIGFIYGFMVYTMRFISVAFKVSLPTIPIPWFDYTFVIEKYFPGASFGIATDIFPYSVGLILPSHVVFGTFIGSFSIYFVGNWISTVKGWALGPWWVPGMDIAQSLQRSIMYIWALPILGITLAAGIVPLLTRPKILRQVLRSFSGIKTGESFSTWMLIPYVAAALFSTILIYVFSPSFPIWISGLMNFGFPIILTLMSTRVLGVTGQWFTPGHVNELVVYASGYPEPDAWFTIFSGSWASQMSGLSWVSRFYVARETETSAKSLIGTFLITLPIVTAISFFFTQLFWSLAKMPSELFPGTSIFWPITATYMGLWTSRPAGLFNPLFIAGGFAAMSIISVLPSLISAIPAGLPISIAAGVALNLPTATAMVIGSVIGMAISRIFGKKGYDEHKLIIVAGLGMGQGVAVVIGVAISLILGSMWVLPY